jgi:hypothetical protein
MMSYALDQSVRAASYMTSVLVLNEQFYCLMLRGAPGSPRKNRKRMCGSAGHRADTITSGIAPTSLQQDSPLVMRPGNTPDSLAEAVPGTDFIGGKVGRVHPDLPPDS